MNEIKRLKRKLEELLKLETRLRKRARRAALPYEQRANRIHKTWVKTYYKLKAIDRPKTLDDAFAEDSGIHGCNPCH